MKRIYEINIKHGMELPEANFVEISEKLEKLPIVETQKEIYDIITVEKNMEEARKEFMNIVKEQLREFDDKHNQVKDAISKYKEKALDFAEETKVVTEKIDIKTGEVKKEVKTELPEGVSYRKGTVSYTFDEDKLDDKFFKKTLKKKEAVNAVSTGEIDYSLVTVVEGKPSITITRSNLKEYKEKYKIGE